MIGAFTAILLASGQPLAAPVPDPEPIMVGESYAFDVLDAERAVNVILPPDYNDDPDKTWPIVVQLDGGVEQDLFLGNGLEKWNRLWGRSQPAILVGIQTVDRQRELLPPTRIEQERSQYPSAGESKAFRDWLADTVLPLVTARYRHDGTTVLLGESAAGHFVVETWLERPEMFSGYAAISPSLQWDGQSLALRAVADLADRPPLYLSLADEGGETEQGVFTLLDKIGESQNYCFSDHRADLHHATSLHGLMPEALMYLLPTEADWLEEYGLGLRCDRGGPKTAAR